MKQIIIVMIFLIGISFNGNAQSNVNVKEMVGFGCYSSGTQSKSVEKVSKLIDKSKFKSIIKLLDSDNNAEKYLAVVVIEKLSELNRIKLTIELNEKISEVYNSDGIVSVCSGCTYFDKLTLKTMLNKENEMRTSANYWLDYKLKQEH